MKTGTATRSDFNNQRDILEKIARPDSDHFWRSTTVKSEIVSYIE